MANYTTRFSCLLPVGAGKVRAALALYARMREELAAEGEAIGFKAEKDGRGTVWLYTEESGEPEHVIAYARRCAQEFGLTGLWGFRWGLGCDKARLDGFGGGAQLLDLGRRESVAWVDCEEWLAVRLAAGEARPASAEALLLPVAAEQGWVPATRAGVLMGFIDALIADDPAVTDRLRAHLAEVSADAGDATADAEEMNCRECGEPVFMAVEGTGHHWGNTMDGIDHGRDRDHTALPDGER